MDENVYIHISKIIETRKIAGVSLSLLYIKVKNTAKFLYPQYFFWSYFLPPKPDDDALKKCIFFHGAKPMTPSPLSTLASLIVICSCKLYEKRG